ncbi:MAG: hypothetical protein ACFFDT_32700 [Candidatus Hodarchaeota archaeon]
MANCEKCGKQIAEGAVFCSACTHGFEVKPRVVPEIDTIKDDVEHEIFSFKVKRSKLSRLIHLLPIFFSISYILVGLIVLFPDLVSPEEASIILPVMIMILGFLIVYRIYRGSQQDYSLFLSLTLVILTFGTAMLVPEYINLILPIGTMLVGLFLVFFLFRHSGRNRVLFLVLTIVIVSLGISMVFPDYITIILAASCILSGLLVFLVKF